MSFAKEHLAIDAAGGDALRTDAGTIALKMTNPQIRIRVLLVALCAFLFFYGLGAFGLVGADEPRYAQVAREMLNRHDWVTPTLLGHVWLEKPVLYYWQAILAFRLGGVTDANARIPGAVDASMLVAAIYFFLLRFRPGSELDGALIAASCVGIVAFARAAATDMPLTATFSIAMLAWYAWNQSQSNSNNNKGGGRGRFYLGAFYVFLALGTLAKGPVAPALAGVIIFIFAAVKGDWRVLLRTLWVPGIVLYLAVALPWYIAVQLSNPEFFRIFILEHNLARFSKDVYHHHQPFWFYIPVFFLAMMPWSFALVLALVERGRVILTEGRKSFFRQRDSWQLFLLIWMFVPIIFFSASESKLPGYILPSVPAGALLIAEYLASRREGSPDNAATRFQLRFAVAHAALCALLILAAFSAASLVLHQRIPPGIGAYAAIGIAAVFAIGISIALLTHAGVRLLTRITLAAVVVSVAVVIRTAAPAIDLAQSARPVAESILSFSHEEVPIAIYKINRMQQYGLEFYLNRATQAYEKGNVPAEPHVLVAKQGSQAEVAGLIPGRRVSYLSSPEQKLDLYWVGK
jgi:4-amino-4-deoxy-L-arabinose transferase-like glycosyltransferase